ncbi:KR domain-containing protein [Micromonospora wenchangensis]
MTGAPSPTTLRQHDWVPRSGPEQRLRSWTPLGADTLGLGRVLGPPATDGEVVVAAWSPGGPDVGVAARDLAALVGGWLRDHPDDGTRLVLVTRGPVLARVGDSPVHTGAWGVLRCALAAHPGRFAMADVDGSPESLLAMCRAVAAGEPELAVRGGRVFVPRLVPTAGTASPTSEDVVLVVGAVDGAGGVLARHLAARPRTGRVVQCAADARGELDDLARTVPLTAVVVAAADPAHLWAVHERTRALGLSRFVVLSTAAGVTGAPGAYRRAAAGAYADAVVRHRRAEGHAGTSLAWGPWAGCQARPDPAEREWWSRLGVAQLSTIQGLRVFDEVWDSDGVVLVPFTGPTGSTPEADLPAALRDRLPSAT